MDDDKNDGNDGDHDDQTMMVMTYDDNQMMILMRLRIERLFYPWEFSAWLVFH